MSWRTTSESVRIGGLGVATLDELAADRMREAQLRDAAVAVEDAELEMLIADDGGAVGTPLGVHAGPGVELVGDLIDERRCAGHEPIVLIRRRDDRRVRVFRSRQAECPGCRGRGAALGSVHVPRCVTLRGGRAHCPRDCAAVGRARDLPGGSRARHRLAAGDQCSRRRACAVDEPQAGAVRATLLRANGTRRPHAAGAARRD